MPEAPASPTPPARLRLNQGRYCGEQIDVAAVLALIRQEAAPHGWNVRTLAQDGPHSVEVFARDVLSGGRTRRRVYLSAGIHGDEPAGPLAMLELVRQNLWPSDVQLTLLPCLNPAGMECNRREGTQGVDFNRDYREPVSAIVQAHRAWLDRQPDYDCALLLHEDWEADGFYLYELAAVPGGARSEAIIDSVARVCPVLTAGRADGWPAEHGIVRPNADPARRPDWPEALYLYQEMTDLCYTFEAPSDYPMATRVAALTTAVTAALSDPGLRREIVPHTRSRNPG